MKLNTITNPKAYELYQYQCLKRKEEQAGHFENVALIEELQQKEYQKLSKEDAFHCMIFIANHFLSSQKTTTEVMILNQEPDDLAAKRTFIELLNKVTVDQLTNLVTTLDYNRKPQRNLGELLSKNYFEIFTCHTLKRNMLNYDFILDHAQVFLSLLQENKNNFSKSYYQAVINSFSFLYPEIKKEKEEEYPDLLPTVDQTKLLATRFRSKFAAYNTDYRESEVSLSDYPFTAAAHEVLKIKNKDFNRPQNIQKWKMFSLYLDSFLLPLSVDQITDLQTNYYYRISQMTKNENLLDNSLSRRLINNTFDKHIEKKLIKK